MPSPPRSSGSDATALAASQPPIVKPESPPSSQEASGYRSIQLRIIGATPLLMHSSRLVNPLDPISKELKRATGKRAKTDADHEYAARIEFIGGLWLAGGEPCLPGEALETCFVQAARKSKRGQQARAGILSPENWPLEYDGPRTAHELWEAERFRFMVPVRIGHSRVVRTRAIFRGWAATVTMNYLDDQFDEADVIDIMRTAGRVIGIGDWRPRFGRFEVES